MIGPARARSTLAWSAYGVALLLAIFAGYFWIQNQRAVVGAFPPQVFVVPGFGLVGAIVTARSRNQIGPLFLALAFVGAATAFTFGWAVHGTIEPDVLPFVDLAAAVSNAGFPFTWLVLGLTFVLFPDGQLPSRRWRPVTVAFVSTGIVTTITSLLVPTLLLAEFTIANPIGIGGITAVADPNAAPQIAVPWNVFGFVLLAVMVSAPIFRRRRADGDMRLQLRWLAATLEAILVLSGLAAVLALLHMDVVVAALMVLLLALFALGIPAAIGIAVMKYRLYEIDVVVRKTVVVGLLALFITVVYVGIVVGVGSLFADTLALQIVATAVVAIAFQPVRSRANRLANRLVYGKRATPYEVLARFADRIGDTYASEDVVGRIAHVIADGTGSELAAVWLLLGDELHLAGTWPTDEGPASLPVVDDELPIPEADRVAVVRHLGETLGVIAIRKPADEPVSPYDTELLDRLADQSGIVLANVRLTADLEARLEQIAHQAAELRASRQRIVAAQDEERRRLERNIHDGAQQHLVALAVKLRLARTMLERDPERGRAMLREIEGEIDAARETIHSLALGIYPPHLEAEGIAPALAAQYERGTLAVRMDTDGLGRYPIDIEAAIYFCVLEALQNAAKYAEASRIDVSLRELDGAITFEVRDDGRGFDPSANGAGTGLAGMRDRLAVFGGSAAIRSAPGQGTVVTGDVPIPSEVPA